ncbi:hypothetical protein BDR26DRAFT_290905 [Obelidium mucronatum]|nr:hypothetical protein BDR26DRAFT_290905 [Obelidium mucronatum]
MEFSSTAREKAIRSAISFYYRQLQYGPWEIDPETGRAKGNPALSSEVKDYMAGLRRHKVQVGDISASVRSISAADMKKIHTYLTTDNSTRLQPTETRHPLGDAISAELYLAFLVAFLCLLRSEEVLAIQSSNIRVQVCRKGEREFRYIGDAVREATSEGQTLTFSEDEFRLEIMLVTRKTHQEGGIKPYYLWMDRSDPHLCAVTAYFRWLSFLGPEHNGHLFVGIKENSQQLKSSQMTRGMFIAMFKNVLKDIGLEWSFYGTHSFRRGGTQYLLNERRWSLQLICEWGGWSLDYDNMTIVRYLHGLYDITPVPRDQMMNKSFRYSHKCHACGRDCPCGPQYSLRGSTPYSKYR